MRVKNKRPWRKRLWSLLPRAFYLQVCVGHWSKATGMRITINEWALDMDVKMGFMLQFMFRGRSLYYGWMVTGMQLVQQGCKKMHFVAGSLHKAWDRIQRVRRAAEEAKKREQEKELDCLHYALVASYLKMCEENDEACHDPGIASEARGSGAS